jgi:hypothetical protein
MDGGEGIPAHIPICSRSNAGLPLPVALSLALSLAWALAWLTLIQVRLGESGGGGGASVIWCERGEV